MNIQDMVSSYINECIEDRSSGFRTDFGVGILVSARAYYGLNEMVVTFERPVVVRSFSLENPKVIISWILNELSLIKNIVKNDHT